MSDTSVVGFIGLGQMGTPMVSHLLEAGFSVIAFDVSDAAVASAAEAGATPAAAAADVAARARTIILMLPDSNVVERVVDDLAPGLAQGSVIIDMSSSEPARTRQLAAGLAGRGVALIDAPVSGGVTAARAGTLTIMVGGDQEVVESVRPVLEAMGRIQLAGPVGAGHAVKALNNLMSATHLWITSEAMIAAERFGLDVSAVLSIVNGSSGRSGSTENKWPNFVLPGTYDSGFRLRLMLKDMRIALALAEELGAPSGLGAAAERFWSEAADALDEAADHTEVAAYLREADETAREKEEAR